MELINAFGQYKLLYETLVSFSEEEQKALVRVLQVADWIKDVSGSYFSPPITLEKPNLPETSLSAELKLDWPDSATYQLALSATQPQFLVCDEHTVSKRGDLTLWLYGGASDAQGDPMLMYPHIPRPLVSAAQQQARGVMGSNSFTKTLAYRAVPLAEDVRTLEAQMVIPNSKKVVSKVKNIEVYELYLFRQGLTVRYTCTLRAAYSELGAKNLHPASLTGQTMRGLALHALSTKSEEPFGVVDGIVPTEPKAGIVGLFKQLLEPAVFVPKAAKVIAKSVLVNAAPTESQATSLTATVPKATVPKATVPKATVPKATVPTEQAIKKAHPRLTIPLSPTTPHSPNTKSVTTELGVSGLAQLPAKTPIDPWQTLKSKISADDYVLRMAQATLQRHRPLLLTGAPGVGKTLLATLLADTLCGIGNFTLVTADARWTSTEVLGGLRVSSGETLKYQFTPGIVTRAAQQHLESVKTTGKPHALIIDEFNRANQDEAFGQLLTVLDLEHRDRTPLIGKSDGAATDLYLPTDFILIATMNDADVGRLYELGMALQRRFTILKMGVSKNERDYLKQQFVEIPTDQFNTLYSFVGMGIATDQQLGQLRGYVTVGTHYMREMLLFMRSGLKLEDALRVVTEPLLAHLTQANLLHLVERAKKVNLLHLAEHLQALAEAALF